MLSRIRQKNSINSQSAFCTRSAVCIFYPVCSLHFVPGLQFAFCTDRSGIADFVWASLRFGPRYRSSKQNFSPTILTAMIDVWTVCWRAPVDKYNDRAIIALNQQKTNANARLTNKAASDALLLGHGVCWNEPATGPFGVNISASRFNLHLQKFGIVIWSYYFC